MVFHNILTTKLNKIQKPTFYQPKIIFDQAHLIQLKSYIQQDI